MKNKIWTAVLLLAVAACIALGSLGYLGSFTGGQIVLIAAMVLIIAYSITDRFISGIIFPLGILYINFGSMIGLREIGTWPTLAICACLCIALNIIFDSFHKGSKHKKIFSFSFDKEKKESDASSMEHSEKGDYFYEMVRFSNKTKYISSENFTKGDVVCRMGSIELYLDKVKVPSLLCSIDVDCKMGNIELYIPSSWNISNTIDSRMGNIEEDKAAYKVVSENAVTLYLTGKVKFGNIEIHRI